MAVEISTVNIFNSMPKSIDKKNIYKNNVFYPQGSCLSVYLIQALFFCCTWHYNSVFEIFAVFLIFKSPISFQT